MKKDLTVSKFEVLSEVWKGLSNDQKKFIKTTIAPDLTYQELQLFMYQSSKTNLDPLNNEIYATAYGQGKYRKLSIFASRNGKRVAAERTGELKGIQTEAIYISKENKRCEPWEGGVLWGAESTVCRKDRKATKVTVPISEYNLNQSVWKSKPETMIKKVAESQALSTAFPDVLGNVYDETEQWKNNPTEVVYEDDNDLATNQQLETLKLLKVEIPEEITKGQARKLINDSALEE